MQFQDRNFKDQNKKRGSVMFAFIFSFAMTCFLVVSYLQTIASQNKDSGTDLLREYSLSQTTALCQSWIGNYLSYEIGTGNPDFTQDLESRVTDLVGSYFSIDNYSQSSDYVDVSALLQHNTLNQPDYSYLNSPLGGLPYTETTFNYFIEGNVIDKVAVTESDTIELIYAVRNSPIARIPFFATQQFNANIDTTVNVTGLAWLHKSYQSSNSAESRVFADTLFIPYIPVDSDNPGSVVANNTVNDKRAAALLGTEPYKMVETTIDYSVAEQYFASSGVLYLFDGFDLYNSVQNEALQSVDYPTGVSITTDYGNRRRLLVDLRNLDTTPQKLYFDCINPSAKERGIVIVGDQGTPQDSSKCIGTNGAVRLVGRNLTPVMIASGYGGIFVDPVEPGTSTYPNAIDWYGAIFAPIRPELNYYTFPTSGGALVSSLDGWTTDSNGPTFSGGTIQQGSGDSCAFLDLGSSGRNFGAVTVSFNYTTGSGGAEYGFTGPGPSFTASDWSNRRTIYVRVGATNVQLCTRDNLANETVLYSFGASGASGSVAMRYNRVGHVYVTVNGTTHDLVLDVDAIKEASFFGVAPNNSGGSISGIAINTRAGGLGLFASQNLTLNIHGSLVVGDTISSNLSSINIIENTNTQLDDISPRVASLMW